MESLSYLSFKGDILEMHALASNFFALCAGEERGKKGWVAGNGVRRGSHGLFVIYCSSSLGSYHKKGEGQHNFLNVNCLMYFQNQYIVLVRVAKS